MSHVKRFYDPNEDDEKSRPTKKVAIRPLLIPALPIVNDIVDVKVQPAAPAKPKANFNTLPVDMIKNISSYVGECQSATKFGKNCINAVNYVDKNGKTLQCPAYCAATCDIWARKLFDMPGGAIFNAIDAKSSQPVYVMSIADTVDILGTKKNNPNVGVHSIEFRGRENDRYDGFQLDAKNVNSQRGDRKTFLGLNMNNRVSAMHLCKFLRQKGQIQLVIRVHLQIGRKAFAAIDLRSLSILKFIREYDGDWSMVDAKSGEEKVMNDPAIKKLRPGNKWVLRQVSSSNIVAELEINWDTDNFEIPMATTATATVAEIEPAVI